MQKGLRRLRIMKYTLYEDPLTHKFALLALPHGFVDGDRVLISEVDRWFGSREEAVAALPELLNRDERNPTAALGDAPDGGPAH